MESDLGFALFMHGEIQDFRKRLLEWFRSNARELPWRVEPSLYKTVVSEFMLQQTQVDTVLPYFSRWMDRLPGFEDLAKAPEQEVLKLWEGLGYYSRARNLHKLAQSIAQEGIPQTVKEWIKRPGIGPYTAAAIASINQRIPEAVIDGNVIRVLSRLTWDTRPITSSSEARKRFVQIAAELIDPQSPGEYNEAIMELGAIICRKTRPACLLCPVRDHCRAAGSGNPEAVPRIQRKPSSARKVARLLLISKQRILLNRYPDDSPRLAGLAELPELDTFPDSAPLLTRSRGISSERISESIFRLDPAHPAALTCCSRSTAEWVPLAHLDRVPLSGPHKQWIHSIIRSTKDTPQDKPA